jgi:16S rRNA (guanine527-N7)-methyltransferase
MRIDGPEAFAAAFDVSRETLARLETFADLLTRWTRRINLVSPGSLPELWHRHIADSAQLPGLAPPEAATWLDLGSGGGLPGLVVAALRPGTAVTLVESDRRKAAFLRNAAFEMGVSVTVLARRIEDLPAGTPDVLSARALAPLPRLLPLAARCAGPETVLLLPKGARAESELTAASADWHTAVEVIPSRTDRDGVILRIRNLRPRHVEP